MARRPTGRKTGTSSTKAVAKSGNGSGEYIPRPEDFRPDPTFKERTNVKVPFWKANRYPLLFFALIIIYYIGAGVYEDWIMREYLKPGVAAYQNGQYPAAEHDLETYLQWWGGDPDGHYYLGMCYLHDRRRDDALQQFVRDTSGFGVRNHEVIYINYRSRVQIANIRH